MGDLLLKLQDAVTIYLGVMLGALPFVLLGVIFSSFLAHFVSEERLTSLIPKNRFLAPLSAMFIGFLFPVCECGNIPVARRLLRKGLPANVAITFLLAAPVINPVTVASTWAAFNFMPEIVWLRVIFTLVISYTIGIIFSYAHKNTDLVSQTEMACHDHSCDHDDHRDGYYVKFARDKFWSFIKSLPEELFEMLAALSMGAILSALFQTVLPRDLVGSLGQGPFMSIIAMIIFAVVISVCSSVDAFIALSYAGTFTNGSILAFLVFGPMIDLKAIWMLKTTFKWKVVMQISLLALFMTVLLTTIYNYYFI